jgi:hypothetical protein
VTKTAPGGPEQANHVTDSGKSKKYDDYWSWDVSKKARENRSKFHWYTFVNAYNWPSSKSSPDIFFVPSEVVADIVTDWNEQNALRLFFRMNNPAASSGVSVTLVDV